MISANLKSMVWLAFKELHNAKHNQMSLQPSFQYNLRHLQKCSTNLVHIFWLIIYFDIINFTTFVLPNISNLNNAPTRTQLLFNWESFRLRLQITAPNFKITEFSFSTVIGFVQVMARKFSTRELFLFYIYLDIDSLF